MSDDPVKHNPPAILALADGSVFIGTSFGAEGVAVGEVVFNTAMTGYQEILTDPSYAQQMVTFTYPHIGNVGINFDDQESERIWLAGMIIRDLSPIVSNWRSQKDLASYLKEQNIVAIKDIDTRRLTRMIREKGAQNCCIITGTIDPQHAIKKAQAFPGIQGQDLAKQVTTKKSYEWKSPTLDLDQPHKRIPTALYHLVVYDYGVKQQILRLLVDRECRVTVVPATMTVKEVLSLQPDGVVLANGPGDPMVCDYAIQQTRELLNADIPLLGICLGFQLLALACGAKTQKMKFGHHGANHPVLDERNKRVYITSQNHGFEVVESTLPDTLEIIHRSLFDRSLQGLRHRYKPALAFQGHPEASPGPREMTDLFDEFMQLVRSYQAQKKQVRENHAW